MRNLTVFGDSRLQVNLEDGGAEKLVAIARDSDHNRVFFGSSLLRIYWIDLSSKIQQCMSLVDHLDTDGEPQSSNTIVDIEYVMEQEALVVGTQAGDLLLVNPSSLQVEVVGAVQGGVVSLAASPNGELLLVGTGLGQLLLMTQEWDLLYEMSVRNPLDSLGDGMRNGSLQASWRGDGKYFATLSADSNSATGRTSLKIWEKETGTLHASGESISCHQTSLTWCPGGARIATSSNRFKTHQPPVVNFFERNGLKKQIFEVVAPADATVTAMQWNIGGELLALSLKCSEWHGVQIWYCSNYHWYLKQEWRFMEGKEVRMMWDPEKPFCIMFWTVSGFMQIVNMCWKSAVIAEDTAFVVSGNELLITPFSVALVPPPMSYFKLKFLAPIKGVTFTNLDANGSVVAACLSNGCFSILQLPSLNTWHLLEGSEHDARIVKCSNKQFDSSLIRNLTFVGSASLVGATVSQNNNEVLVKYNLVFSENDSSEWDIEFMSEIVLEEPVIDIVSCPYRFSSDRHRVATYVQLQGGSIFPFHLGEGVELDYLGLSVMRLSSPSPWMQVVLKENIDATENVILGLDEHGKLQVGGIIISDECTTYTLHSSTASKRQKNIVHVLYTTRSDTLHVVSLHDLMYKDSITLCDVDKYSGLGPTTNGSDAGLDYGSKARKGKRPNDLKVLPLWERGASLITAVGGGDNAVILQTVRGNLETIYPRSLVLHAIANTLSEFHFKDALLLARRHHFDLNVVVDLIGVEKFSNLASEFVKQVGQMSLVTELVCALNNENVLETKYKNLSPLSTTVEKAEAGHIDAIHILDNKKVNINGLSKVEKVLSSIRGALEESGKTSPSKELCIITTLARAGSNELGQALQRVKQLRSAEIVGDCAESLQAMEKLSAETALKHLIWLTDAHTVFDAALGLYDLHLAAMVATHSQQDPKEFLPYLQRLEEMPAPLMRYSIDCRLGRYETALRNLAAGGDSYFEECLRLIKENPDLYLVGLGIFKQQRQRFVLLEAWGGYLLGEGKFEDAAAAFCACSQFQNALGAYRSGGLWRNAMIVAGRLSLTDKEVGKLAAEIREELQAMGKPAEAAEIAIEYCKDANGAIDLLIEARNWIEAVRLAYLYGRSELLDSKVKPAAIECAQASIVEFEEGLEKVGRYYTRHVAVHQRRLALTAKLKEEGQVKDLTDDDAASEISSNLSDMSVYTRGSARSSTMQTTSGISARSHLRKHKSQQKAHSGKIRAGSPGEELALIEHLRSLAVGDHTKKELISLMQVLLIFNHQDLAQLLQNTCSKFQMSQEHAFTKAEQTLKEEDDQKGSINHAQIMPSSKKQAIGHESGWGYEIFQVTD
ncbi:hypothetical protein O6H91_05G115300 [Diphasiastrum complanatum]|uniref:Uncharacterized protein n=2 Tax=Diphasiastrum complanatum TaxID=34168 RepID=A0ACC2DSV1_DIPCM|nr:hypothetical protein O6H91_05G115300 [Diphasiastrum complanatum]KAJ7557186.1 hypothetical protein O6H91_05G115300 [Diphasiastrum complanatum]